MPIKIFFNTADSEQIEDIAELHRNSLPDDIPTILGKKFLKGMYAVFAGSDSEIIFVDENDVGKISCVAVFTHSPEDMSSRILKGIALNVLAEVAFKVLTTKSLREYLANLFREIFKKSSPLLVPEIVYIFVSKESRGSGIGNAMLRHIESHSNKSGIHKIYVKTLYSEDNAAIGFYRKCGYDTECIKLNGGREFIYFSREIKHTAKQ